MYGCNNFCTYCIVPLCPGPGAQPGAGGHPGGDPTAGREGYKDITLLGQNVNSYGKDLGENVDFPTLLEMANAIPGDFLLRFMTSHPKDATERLFDVMARCEKVAPVIHLPFQSGNTRGAPGDEPPVYPGAVSGQGPGLACADSGRGAHQRRHRGLSRGDNRRV